MGAATLGSRALSAGAWPPAGSGSPGGTDGTGKEGRLENKTPSQMQSSSYYTNIFTNKKGNKERT